MTEQQQIEWQLNIEKTISEIAKNQADFSKAGADIRLSDKKLKWYEASLLLAVFGLGIALAKLFL